MPAYTAYVRFDLHQLLGDDFDTRRTKAYVTTNVENGTLIDTTSGEIRMGDQAVTINSDGTGEFSTWTPDPDMNPVSWQTSFVVDYPRTGHRDRTERTFGPYTIDVVTLNVTNKSLTSNVATLTFDEPHGQQVGDVFVVSGVDATFNTVGTAYPTVTAVPSPTSLSFALTASDVASTAATGTVSSLYMSLALLEEEQAIPPNYQTAFTESMEAIRDDAEDARDLAQVYRDEAAEIALGDVPNATTSVRGAVELATNAETTTGTDAVRAVTPAGVKNVLDPIRNLTDSTFITNLDASFDLKSAESLALHSPVGTGLSDTVSAFAAAATAAPSGGVVTVPQPATEYLWSSVLTITKPLTFIAPQGATIRLASNELLSIQSSNVKFIGFTFVKAVAQPWLNLLRPRTTPVVQATGVEFRYCKFDGVALRFWAIGTLNPDGTTQASGTGTDIKTAKVLDCEFTNYAESYTVYFAGSTLKDNLVERCWFHDYGLNSSKGEGVKIQGGAVGTRVRNNIFENSTRDGVDGYDSVGTLIEGNTFRNMAALAVDLKWNNTENVNNPRQHIVVNNRAISCTGGGFHCDGPESVVANNLAISCGYGFKVGQDETGSQATKRVSFVNNKSISATNDGFSIGPCDSVIVQGNQSYGSGGYGFATISTATNGALIGNTAFGNTSGGIQGDAATQGFTLIGNVTQDTATNGAIVLQNGKMLYARKTDGTQLDAVKMSTGNVLQIGHSSVPLQLSGSQTNLDKTLVRKRSTQTLAANGTVTIDILAAQIHEVTLNANATGITVSNSTSGMEFTLCFIQDATGGRTVTWPSGFKFAGSAPSDPTANTRTIVQFLAGGSGTWREVSRTVAVP